MEKRLLEQEIELPSKQPRRSARILSNAISVSNIQPQTSVPNDQLQLQTFIFINFLPIELLPLIFNHLETFEQCTIRRVCHVWKNSIEKMFELKHCLKLNLIKTENRKVDKEKVTKFSPEPSIQSLQFDSNWTEPKQDLSKTAKFTVTSRHFKNENCALVLARLFARVSHLVVYYELSEYQKNWDNFVSMIKCLQMLQSFSFIRSTQLVNRHFIPTLCDTLEQGIPLRRFELYVERIRNITTKCPKREIPMMMKSLEIVQHFALGSWPPMITLNDQRAIMKNVGALLKNEREIRKNNQIELNSLCIPMNSDKNVDTCIDVANTFANNVELQNVKRLMLSKIYYSMDRVKPVLELCPKLQSLTLCNFEGIEINTFIQMLNQCKHLTEVNIFDGCLGPFETGSCAPHIRKLTIGGTFMFDKFVEMLEKRDKRQEEQVPIRGSRQDRNADEFVKMISLKFPSLEELTVLTFDYNNSRKNGPTLRRMITSQLNAIFNKKLKVNLSEWDFADYDMWEHEEWYQYPI